MDPFFRPRKLVEFKTDHPTMGYKNPGHLLNPGREEFVERQKNRVYSAWEPPRGGEARQGKKILGERPVNDGRAFQEQE